MINSIEDIIAIDGELASLFLRPDEAVNWVNAVENGIKDWVQKHNKQYWEVVRFVSEERGILGKLRKDRKTVWLKREDFARVLLKFCPNAFEKSETASALKASMEHYEFASTWKDLDMKCDGHKARHYIKEVEDLLDNKPIVETHEEVHKPTLVDLMVEYLRREVDESKYPQSKVCIRPQYEGVNPAISIETYKSEQFLKEHRPSHIDVYEFVDGVLQESKLNELTGKYQGKRMKLYIVSSSGLHPQIRVLATNRDIGYVRLNPNSEMTSENYVLPRSIEDYTKRTHNLDVLAGKPMTTPILIMDGSKLTSSLTDVLSENGVAVKKHRLLIIPYLSDNEIEKRANDITKEDVENRIEMFNSLTTIYNINLSLDPFLYAESFGLEYKEEIIEETFQLGRLDIETNSVTLNSKGLDNNKRYRFTMAHELGHYLLHTPLFKQQGVVSIGESEDTLSISKGYSRRLEYQANKFASCILMPEKLIRRLYSYFFEFFVHNIYGDSFHALYYNPKQKETWVSYNGIVRNMANLLNVSMKAMEIRLKSLELLITPD